MRALTKIKLINWHYFSNVTIPIEGSALITGDNGAGKSTLIDALQVVLIANLRSIRFNSSAFDEKTTRDIKGYLRGKTGAEGTDYLRGQEDFSSYVVLEITHTPTGKPFLIGVVFDYYSSTGQEEHLFFKIDDRPLEDSLFLDGGTPRNRAAFIHHLEASGVSFRQYKNDIEGYRADLRQLFGNVKETFFSLLPKGISFSPITNLRQFVYDYILEDRPVDVASMRESFEKYRQLERTIVETKEEIEALEVIGEAWESVGAVREQQRVGVYMQKRAGLEVRENLAREKEEGRKKALAAAEEASLSLEREAERKKGLSLQRDDILRKLSNNETTRRLRELEEKKARLKEDLGRLMEERKNLQRRVAIEVREIETAIETLRALGAPLELSDGLLEGLDAWKAYREDESRFPKDPQALAAAWREARDWSVSERSALQQEQEELVRREAELKEQIASLEKDRVLGPSSPTMKLKALLEEHLIPRGGEKCVPVRVFCEAVEIKDPSWRDAIEGYLHTQKFDLLVPPGYFDEALALYERFKFTHGIERVGLVNTEKLLSSARRPLPGSLAEEIAATEDYVKAYADWLLGGVIKCQSEAELKKHRRSITRTCMLYQNHTARQIPKSRYEVPFIGKEAVAVQLKRRREELKECQGRLAEIWDGLEAVRQLLELPSDKSERYASFAGKQAEVSAVPRLESELIGIEESLLNIDRSEVEALEAQERLLRERIDEADRRIQELAGREASKKDLAERLASEAAELSAQAAALRSDLEDYAGELGPDLLKKCEDKWRTESKKKSPVELGNNYERSNLGLETKIQNLRGRLVRLRADFTHRFNFGGDPEAEDNRAFDERLKTLKDTHLPEYEDKAAEARQKAEGAFREHFLARLKESIENARIEIDELNRALKDLSFSGNRYRFRLSPKAETAEYYQLIDDPNLFMGESLFTAQIMERHGETVERFFAEVTAENADREPGSADLTDYRTYLDFEIVITDEDGNKSYFSKVSRDKSGGETQVPFYVAVLASFYQVYHLYRRKDALRLVIFDEAFNRMDADNIEECARFIGQLGFQALIVAPTGKVGLLVPHVNTNIIVMREGFQSFVELAVRRDIEAWAAGMVAGGERSSA